MRATHSHHSRAVASGNDPGGNPLNQYVRIEYPGTTPLQPDHDADGNLTSGPVPGANGLNPGVPVPANAALTWDAENRLVKAVVNNTTINYEYDHHSRLISRSMGVSPTSATHYLYDGWNRIAEFEKIGTGQTLERTYLWGMDLSGSMQGAGGVGGLLSMRAHGTTPATFYPTYDGNGNISEYVNHNGVKTAHFEYDPFGNLTVDSEGNASDFPYRFGTKPQDLTTGLYFYGYRWYDPATDRWASRDPIKEMGGMNLYSFLDNSGIDQVDVLGMFGDGHHQIPKASWVGKVSDAVAAIFDSDRARIHHPCWAAHNRRKMGGVSEERYRRAVEKQLDDFMKRRNIGGLARMQAPEAEAFLRLIKRMNDPLTKKYNGACRLEVRQSLLMVRGKPPGAKVVWRRGIGLVVPSLTIAAWWASILDAPAAGEGSEIHSGVDFWSAIVHLGSYSTNRLIGEDNFACLVGSASCKKLCIYSATMWEVYDRGPSWNGREVDFGGIFHSPVGSGRFSLYVGCGKSCPRDPAGAFDVDAEFWGSRIHSRNISDEPIGVNGGIMEME